MTNQGIINWCVENAYHRAMDIVIDPAAEWLPKEMVDAKKAAYEQRKGGWIFLFQGADIVALMDVTCGEVYDISRMRGINKRSITYLIKKWFAMHESITYCGSIETWR